MSKETFTTYRYWFKNGHEDDEIMVTVKEFTSFKKAMSYAHRYANGLKFAGVQIEDNNGDVIYEITSDGTVYNNYFKPVEVVKSYSF